MCNHSDTNNTSSQLSRRNPRLLALGLHSSIDADSSYNIGLPQCFYIPILAGLNPLGCGLWIELYMEHIRQIYPLF